MRARAELRAARIARARRRVRQRTELPTEVDLAGRIADLGNPVLVRELQQAMNGRSMHALSMVASYVIVWIGLEMMFEGGSALVAAGRAGFRALWTMLLPVIWFLTPMLAFVSMRREVLDLGADHLLLSDLGPARVVTGKLGSSALLCAHFLMLFAPMIALTFALQGVDLATFLWTLWLAVATALALASLAIALASFCSFRFLPRQRPLVPRSRREALCMLPFLPGSGRGVVYTVVLAAIVLLSGLGSHVVFASRLPDPAEVLVALVAIELMLLYACFFCWLRNHRIEQTRIATAIARVRFPGLVLLGLLLVTTIDGLVFIELLGGPTFLVSIVNPVVALGMPNAPPLGVQVVILGVLVAWWGALCVDDVRSSVREVLGSAPATRTRRRARSR